MKKIITSLFLFGILAVSTLSCMAECTCTSDVIAYRLKNASSWDLKDIFDKMVDSADFSPSSTVKTGFAAIIYEAKNETKFKNALKYYVTNYCSVDGKQIKCQ